MKLPLATVSCLLLSSLMAQSDSAIAAKCPPAKAKATECTPSCSETNKRSAATTSTPDANKCPVLSPCAPRTYSCSGITIELYGECLVLQPNGSNLYYATEAIPFDPAIATPAASPNWEVFEISPHYSPGFQVGAVLLFPTSDINLELNWERLHSHRKASHTAALARDMVGPIFDIGPNSAAYQTAKGEGTFHFDGANLIFGKKVCFFNSLYTNFYTGAGFTRIKQTMYSKYSNLSGTISRSIYAPSTFMGAGPQFGVAFDYLLGKNFYFTGSSSASLFMGQLKNSTTYESSTPDLAALGNPQPNVQHTTVPSRSQLVPGFEEQLGFSYAIESRRCKVVIGAGYQFQIYLNAVQSVDMVSQALPTDLVDTPDVGLFAVAFQRTLSNFILTGPYASLAIEF